MLRQLLYCWCYRKWNQVKWKVILTLWNVKIECLELRMLWSGSYLLLLLLLLWEKRVYCRDRKEEWWVQSGLARRLPVFPIGCSGSWLLKEVNDFSSWRRRKLWMWSLSLPSRNPSLKSLKPLTLCGHREFLNRTSTFSGPKMHKCKIFPKSTYLEGKRARPSFKIYSQKASFSVKIHVLRVIRNIYILYKNCRKILTCLPFPSCNVKSKPYSCRALHIMPSS